MQDKFQSWQIVAYVDLRSKVCSLPWHLIEDIPLCKITHFVTGNATLYLIFRALKKVDTKEGEIPPHIVARTNTCVDDTNKAIKVDK